MPGVYAAGDIRKKPLRQVVTACSDGAVAAMQVEHDLASGRIDATQADSLAMDAFVT